jgi:hypothetical protein
MLGRSCRRPNPYWFAENPKMRGRWDNLRKKNLNLYV